MDLESKAINTIRFLSADAVEKAKSGHPGLPMGDAAIAYTIWTKHLRFDPRNPSWINRDRFVLSGGHGSMLLYSLLHLTGYDLSLEDIESFRQWQSKTPGHPEYGLTPGVDLTTGPLGQGFANGVGMAIAQAHLASEFNQPGFNLFDHYIYGIVTDGDLMEGIASEAASLAGHLQLGRIIYCYDDNRISIDGSTELAFTEDRGKRFEAYGWQVLYVDDGNDVGKVDRALREAKIDPHPSLIVCRTHIGYGLPTRQDTQKAHGEAPGEEELNGAKKNLGWPLEPSFYIPEDVSDFYLSVGKAGHQKAEEWAALFEKYKAIAPEKGAELARRIKKELPNNWDANLPQFAADAKGIATRVASGKTLNALASVFPEIVGGSADLTPSNNTWLEQSTAFEPGNPQGRYFHFGVREHGMGGLVNGMAYYGALIPFGATFLIFTDYMRGALRLSALSRLHCVWVMTHDSVGLGEDGPTHQPIEQLASLRAMPNMTVIRPGDANETREAWKVAIENKEGPTLLALTRQAVPTLDRTIYASEKGLHKGAYVLADLGKGTPEIILMATGSEVSLIVGAGEMLAKEGHSVRLVSFPSWELFAKAGKAYQAEVLPPAIKKRVAVEMASPMGWERWVGDEGKILGIDHFGASAPLQAILKGFGFTIEHVYSEAKALLEGK